MTQANTTALPADQVEGEIRIWMEAGLPEGRISWPALRGQYVRVQVENPTAVCVWAAALGADVEVTRTAIKTTAAFPVVLRGWDIQVWCTAPIVPDTLRISTAGGVR